MTFSRIKNDKTNLVLETKMDEAAFRLLRQGLPKHLHGRLIYINGSNESKVIARGLGLQTNNKQLEDITNWLSQMLEKFGNTESLEYVPNK